MPLENPLSDSSVTHLLDDWFPDDDTGLQQLRAQTQFVHLPAGYRVFRRGDICRSYFLVVQGSVRVQAPSSGGRDLVLYRVAEGQSCMMTTCCLIGGETYPADGVTETETTTLAISQGVFNETLHRSGTFRRFVFANQGQRLGDLVRRIEGIAFGRVDVRLARLLYDRGQRHGADIQATHQQLARELGTAREVVSRQLKAFEKRNWIGVSRGHVKILNASALAKVWKNSA